MRRGTQFLLSFGLGVLAGVKGFQSTKKIVETPPALLQMPEEWAPAQIHSSPVARKSGAPSPALRSEERIAAGRDVASVHENRTVEEACADYDVVDLEKVLHGRTDSWLNGTLDAHAPYQNFSELPEDKAEESQILQGLQDMGATSQFWRGNYQIRTTDHLIEGTFFLQFDGDNGEDNRPCLNLRHFVRVDGENLGGFYGSAGGCGASFRRVGDGYYMELDTFYSSEISDSVSIILVPVPIFGPAPLEYMQSHTDNWIQISDFSWSPSSEAEMTAAAQ